MPLTDQQKMENVEEYLDRYGLRVEQLLAFVPDLDEGQCAVFSGAIPKGLGHAASDIDILVLGGASKAPADAVSSSHFTEEIIRLETGHVLNIYHISAEILNGLGARVRSLVESAFGESEGAKFDQFSNFELDVMQWIFNGLGLSREDSFTRWQVTLGSALLPVYVYVYNALRAKQIMDDARSFLEKGNDENALWALRMSADHLAIALLGSIGEVALSPKWRLSMLRENAGAIGSGHVRTLIEYLTIWPIDEAAKAVTAYEAFCNGRLEESQEENQSIAPLVRKMIEEMA